MRVEPWLGPVPEFIASDFEPDDLTVMPVHIGEPMLIVGSTQTVDLANGTVPVLRRRSGGGAVLLHPDSAVWVDVVVPRHHPLYETQIERSSMWLATAIQREFAGDFELPLDIARVNGIDQFGHLLCFGGIGIGELTCAGRKVIGVAQRRGKWGARMQILAYTQPMGEATVAAMSSASLDRPAGEAADELDERAMALQQPATEIVQRLLSTIADAASTAGSASAARLGRARST